MAYIWLDDLDQALDLAGIPFVEVGPSTLDPTGASSWRQRGRPASTGAFDVSGVLCHHTASPAGTSAQADLNVILAGNSEAPGPVSQLYVSREPRLYLVAGGRANHGGKGQRPGVDGACADMNAHLIGIEAGNDGRGERWSDAMCDLYGATVAALCAWYGWDVRADVYLHATTGPPDGGCNSKIDPAGPWTRQPAAGQGTWSLDVWRDFCAAMAAPPQPQPGADLVHTLIRVRGSYAVFAGDMDAQGIVHWCRWLGPGLNQSIGFQPDNQTPRIPGTKVLDRDQADMATISLVGPVPHSDLLAWSPASFYQGG